MLQASKGRVLCFTPTVKNQVRCSTNYSVDGVLMSPPNSITLVMLGGNVRLHTAVFVARRAVNTAASVRRKAEARRRFLRGEGGKG